MINADGNCTKRFEVTHGTNKLSNPILDSLPLRRTYVVSWAVVVGGVYQDS